FRADSDGIVAVAWGVTLTALIALAVPAGALAVKAYRLRVPAAAVRRGDQRLRERFRSFALGVPLPIALQLLYIVSLPFAAREGTGAATSFVYAYLAGSALVSVTAGALGLVTAVPLSRTRFSAPDTVRHVVSSSWPALVLVGAASGAFAVAGGEAARVV